MTTPILGLGVADEDHARWFAAARGAVAWWADLIPIYWDLAPRIGVRADVAFAQACKETGFGKFGRAVTPAHHNPCGLKVPDPAGKADNDPAAHQTFPTWQVGIRAHLEHLALYAGAPGYPLTYSKTSPTTWIGATVDPRHFNFLRGRSGDSVEGLGGSWAPDPNYGVSIVRDYLRPMIGA